MSTLVRLNSRYIHLCPLLHQFVSYSADIDASRGLHGQLRGTNQSHVNFYTLYPVFQSNTLLIFFGISFLYFFMKKVIFVTQPKCRLSSIIILVWGKAFLVTWRLKFFQRSFSMDSLLLVIISSSVLWESKYLFYYKESLICCSPKMILTPVGTILNS